MQTLHLNSPIEIYDEIQLKVQNIARQIEASKQIANESNIQEILTSLQKDIEKAINELKINAEWKYFTIALFGETNAGKSTIIETLRILLNEATKISQQKKFRDIQVNLTIREEDFDKVQADLKNIDEEFNQIKIRQEKAEYDFNIQSELLKKSENELLASYAKKIAELSSFFDDLMTKTKKECEVLTDVVFYKKSIMPWWLKIVYIFKRLEEEKKLYLLLQELNKLPISKSQGIESLKKEQQLNIESIIEKNNNLIVMREKEDKLLKSDFIKLQSRKNKLIELLKNLNEKLSELELFRDGVIVGDGRSDFTRMSKEFDFFINQCLIKIIDVPGIEGDEVLVENEIMKAVKKSHAVFYVTNKDAPPNEGTLAKITKHLNDQTEVWAIFNKPITNPRQLKGELIKNEDERKALNDLNEKMQEALGKSYQKYIVIAGLAAFYAVATCFVPFSLSSKNQKKFLEKLDRDELLEFSQLKYFKMFLEKEVVGNVSAKIKKSNFTKADFVLMNAVRNLSLILKDTKLLESDIDKQIKITIQETDGCFLDLEQNLKKSIDNAVDSFKSNVRNDIYRKINNDISNDEFKRVLELNLRSGAENLQYKLEEDFQCHFKDFDSNVKQKIQKMTNKLDSLFNSYSNYIINDKKITLNLNFDDMKNGINKIGLAGVGMGAILLGLSQLWNPVGWGILAVAIGGLVVSFAKAIWSVFSSDFKKSEQKKNVDKNLSRICNDIENKAKNNLSEVILSLEKEKIKLRKNLDRCNLSVSGLNKDIQKSINEFSQLSQAIKQEYGV